MVKAGVYQILNIVNNKRYIGSSVDIPKRWREHLHSLRQNVHCSRYLQRALGCCRSEQTRLKISESLKGRILSDEHKRKVSESIKLMWDRRRRSQC